ncbi:hypothetical protein [Mycolicibacterium llatzerense]|uniref:hypothetical protein n=1 Tax=Mycolicibacterium llatzerense TaxID=280871 RepID=UPI0008DE362B|nr:hypothetical protein [Mycolicibacterium llatzerense]
MKISARALSIAAALAGALVVAPSATGDPLDSISNYWTISGPTICRTLDADSSTTTFQSLMYKFAADGYGSSYAQSVILSQAVNNYCFPSHGVAAQTFIASWRAARG